MNQYIRRLSAVLNSSTVSHAPLEVGLWVGLDEGVDGSDSALGVGGGVVGGGGRAVGRGVPPHPHHLVQPVIQDEDPTCRSADKQQQGEEKLE